MLILQWRLFKQTWWRIKKWFKNTCKFSSKDINEIILLLRKGFYSYEHIDEWERVNETSFPEKEDFYSNLNMKDITDVDYVRAKIVCKDLEIKSFGKCYEMYLKIDTLLLADVYKGALENTDVKLEWLTYTDMLLIRN